MVQQQVQQIEELYQSFGPAVVRAVQSQLNRYGTLLPLLAHLGVPAIPGMANQHRALKDFLFRYGAALFLRIVQTDMPMEEVERLKMTRIAGHARSALSDTAPAAMPPSATPDGDGKPPISVSGYTGRDRRMGLDCRKQKFGRRGRNNAVLINRRRTSDAGRRCGERRRAQIGLVQQAQPGSSAGHSCALVGPDFVIKDTPGTVVPGKAIGQNTAATPSARPRRATATRTHTVRGPSASKPPEHSEKGPRQQDGLPMDPSDRPSTHSGRGDGS